MKKLALFLLAHYLSNAMNVSNLTDQELIVREFKSLPRIDIHKLAQTIYPLGIWASHESTISISLRNKDGTFFKVFHKDVEQEELLTITISEDDGELIGSEKYGIPDVPIIEI